MFGFTVTIDASALNASIRRFEASLNREVRAAVERSARRIATEARQNHPYTNRTGLLESQTRAVPASGSFLAGTIQAAAVANTPYASYLEARPEFAFMQPAWRAVESYVTYDIETSLSRAAVQSGWV